MKKAVVAMSGGVDSSVAAALMKEQGYDVTGIMLKLWKGSENTGSGCCSVDAAEDARRVAQVLDMPFYVFNFADQFEEKVIQTFVEGYSAGNTPNPCIECNRSIKFSLLLERAMAFGASVLATGHHARISRTPSGPRLLRGRDASKDQSYVLYMLGARDLESAAFPVGEHTKEEVRSIARELGLRTAEKPESQEICFVPGLMSDFIDANVPAGSVAGPVLDPGGSRIGTHRGFAHYTVGQRRGLGVSVGVPLYVREVRAADNAVIVDTLNGLSANRLKLRDVSFTAAPPAGSLRATIMTRYRGPEAEGTVERSGGGWTVEYDEPQTRPATGQAAVFYLGDEVAGGGTIEAVA